VAGLKIEYYFEGDYPVVRSEGFMSIASFSALNMVIHGITEQVSAPVIIDFSGDLVIAEELKSLNCKGVFGCPFGCILIIVAPYDRMAEINKILDLPHSIRYARSVNEARFLAGKIRRKRKRAA